VQFKLDGANLPAEDLTPPYSLSWNTTTTSNGPHTLTPLHGTPPATRPRPQRIDHGEQSGYHPPVVSITAPSSGSTVFGTAVTVSANASDNVGVVGVQFKAGRCEPPDRRLDAALFSVVEHDNNFQWNSTC